MIWPSPRRDAVDGELATSAAPSCRRQRPRLLSTSRLRTPPGVLPSYFRWSRRRTSKRRRSATWRRYSDATTADSADGAACARRLRIRRGDADDADADVALAIARSRLPTVGPRSGSRRPTRGRPGAASWPADWASKDGRVVAARQRPGLGAGYGTETIRGAFGPDTPRGEAGRARLRRPGRAPAASTACVHPRPRCGRGNPINGTADHQVFTQAASVSGTLFQRAGVAPQALANDRRARRTPDAGTTSRLRRARVDDARRSPIAVRDRDGDPDLSGGWGEGRTDADGRRASPGRSRG